MSQLGAPRDRGSAVGGAQANSFACPDCDGSFRTAQGLAGHRRLAHSTSTLSELNARGARSAEREATAKRREAELTRQVEAARQTDADLGRREEAVRVAEAVPERERIGTAAARQIARLPEVRAGAILRVNGVDYRLSESGLTHVYWPKGEKFEVGEGERFRLGGRAYCIRSGQLRPVPASAILARLLGEEE